MQKSVLNLLKSFHYFSTINKNLRNKVLISLIEIYYPKQSTYIQPE